MARGDLLISLVKAGVSGDRAAVRAVVESIIAEEKGKRHTILADRLTRAMQPNGSGMNMPRPASETGRRAREFIGRRRRSRLSTT